MNDGLSSANFLQGAMQGYQFMQGIDDHKKEMSLRDAQEKRAVESHQAQMENNRQSQQINAMRMQQMDQQQQDQIQQRFWQKAAATDGIANWTADDDQQYRTLTNGSKLADPAYISSPEVTDALNVWHQVRSGELDYNDPVAIDAANKILNVQRGAKDGRQVRISRVIPSADGSGVHFALDAVEADGTVNKNRPLTDNRSADPNDTVSTLSIGELDRVFGTAAQVNAAVRNPKVRQAMYRVYGITADPERDRDLARRGKEADINYKNAQAKYYSEGGRSGAAGSEKLPADAQMIKFYMDELGLSQEDAVEKVKTSKSSPEQFILASAKAFYESEKAAGNEPDWNDAVQKGAESYQKQFGKKKPGAKQDAPNRFDSLPDAGEFKGKNIRDDATGVIYKSDGKQWVPVNDSKPAQNTSRGAAPSEVPAVNARQESDRAPVAQKSKPEVPAAQDPAWIAAQAEKRAILEASIEAKKKAKTEEQKREAEKREAQARKNEEDQRRLRERQSEIAKNKVSQGEQIPHAFSANGFDRK